MHNQLSTIMNVNEYEIRVLKVGDINYISLTDLAKYGNSDDPSGVIRNWMSNKDSFDYYGLWEKINNPSFNSVEFHGIKIKEVGYNRFTMTPNRWKRDFNAIGIIPNSGRYSSGTFAHPDIAFEFASWLSPEFKLYLIKEFERLKAKEAYDNKMEWSVRRLIAKANYRLHTDSIKNNLLPNLTDKQKKLVYATEADVINVALFGMTANEWKNMNPSLNGNIRDYASIIQLVVLSNLEAINSSLIDKGVNQQERLCELNKIAIRELSVLIDNSSIQKIESIKNS